jgi:hypothetical protein
MRCFLYKEEKCHHGNDDDEKEEEKSFFLFLKFITHIWKNLRVRGCENKEEKFPSLYAACVLYCVCMSRDDFVFISCLKKRNLIPL